MSRARAAELDPALPGPAPSRRGSAALAAAAGGALLLLTVAVRFGLSAPLDHAVRQWARPDDVWGATQVRADVIVEGLRPTMTLLLTVVVVAVVALTRRSPRPLLLAVATVLVLVAGTVGLKLLLHRPDPHGAISDHGGSFPSGHTVTVVVCAGLVTMLLAPGRHPSWWITPALLLGALMAVALVLQAAHWVTDVLAGGLTGLAILAGLVRLGADRWCAAGRRTTRPPPPARRPS